MGIHNFGSFLSSSGYSSSETTEFDSILVDIQSYLYIAIQETFKEEENDIINDICLKVFKKLTDALLHLFKTKKYTSKVKVIITFDGEGLPMKYPTQKARRNIEIKGKNLYRIVLFGHNSISHQVSTYLVHLLENNFSNFKDVMCNVVLPSQMKFIVCGSDIEGEGEHKLFFLGRAYHCRKPIIVSIDNDVFIISLRQFKHFDSIQIYKNQN